MPDEQRIVCVRDDVNDRIADADDWMSGRGHYVFTVARGWKIHYDNVVSAGVKLTPQRTPVRCVEQGASGEALDMAYEELH